MNVVDLKQKQTIKGRKIFAASNTNCASIFPFFTSFTKIIF